jgi:hypothetical protein
MLAKERSHDYEPQERLRHATSRCPTLAFASEAEAMTGSQAACAPICPKPLVTVVL